MKKCPSCGRTYTDPALNFCLQDGTVLEQETVSTFGNEETVFMGQTPGTNPGGSSPYSKPNNPPATWAASPYTTTQPKKRKSRAWLWILLSFLSFGAIAVVGFFGFLVYLGMKIEQESKNKKAATVNAGNSTKIKSNSNSNLNSKTESADSVKEDFSKWNTGAFNYGKVDYKDDKLIVSSKDVGHYMVISTAKNFLTNDAITKVTVENSSDAKSKNGFGLVMNASPVSPLMKDYAFLIRTTDTPAYKIVSHVASKETTLVDWTKNSEINGGDDENLLEVRDEGAKLSFYINGEFVTSINDEYGAATSIGGVYAGDPIPIAFSNLEVNKSK